MVTYLYGFSPVCVLRCSISMAFLEQAWSQYVHLYGFSPLCTASICFFRHFKFTNVLEQMLQVFGDCLQNMKQDSGIECWREWMII